MDFDPQDSVEFNNLSKVQSHDEPIVKISPPTPSRKSSFTLANDVEKNDSKNKQDIELEENVLLKLKSLKEKRKKNALLEDSINDKMHFDNLKFYPKEKCPLHKNKPPPQIFDDDLKKYLPNKTIYEKPLSNADSVKSLKKKSNLCSLHSNKCKINEKVNIKNTENLALIIDSKMEENISEYIQKPVKAPKLGKASLLASFAKTVSIPSSVETHESSDEDYKSDINLESAKKNTNEFSKSVPKDYLRVPKLGYASLHPSFRKLIPMDSFSSDKEIENSVPEIVSEYSFSFNKPKLDAIETAQDFRTDQET